MFNWTGEIPPEFDQALADSYIGKYILIGITTLDPAGDLVEQIQLHGSIISISIEGIKVSLEGKREGETYILPPHLDSIKPGSLGSYTLRSTDEVIEAPDLITMWTITKPADQ